VILTTGYRPVADCQARPNVGTGVLSSAGGSQGRGAALERAQFSTTVMGSGASDVSIAGIGSAGRGGGRQTLATSRQNVYT
jgi:hypothetical protein